MFDKTYYENRKAELQKEYQDLVIETEVEVERIIIKKLNKTQELQKKMEELDKQEKESKEKKK